MAEEDILVSIKVDTSESAKSLKQLRAEYKEQQKALEGLTIGSQEYIDRKSTRLNSSHVSESRMPSSA